jgi:Holliday junction resolvase RusA-like endonuclease
MGLQAPPQCTHNSTPHTAPRAKKKERKEAKKMICFFHECNPPKSTAQQRQFFGKGKTALKPAAKKASATWQAIVEQHKPEKPLQGALFVRIGVTWFKNTDKAYIPRTVKPDVDNLAKLILDAMTKSGYWQDDKQVYNLNIAKFDGLISGLQITVEETK